MKTTIIFGIVVVAVISAVAIFASIPSDTWQDNRTTFQGDVKPDEISEKIDCLSKGGLWTGNSCSIPDYSPPKVIQCTGECLTEKVTKVVDGDTLYTDNYKIRLSLTNTPEKDESGFQQATSFTAMSCPVGSMITVDQDDLQPFDKFGRLLGKVYCENGVLNEILLNNGLANIMTEYCNTSEFSNESWALKYGCGSIKESTQFQNIVPDTSVSIPKIQNDCDESYPDFCIPPSPPDLDCKDIAQKRFKVLPPDPHRLDSDGDGIGCEK